MLRVTINDQLTVTKSEDRETIQISSGPHEMDWVELERSEAGPLARVLQHFAETGTLPVDNKDLDSILDELA